MRPLLLAALLITAPAPAVAQWRYDPTQSMAVAYCAAREAGQSEQQAMNAASGASVRAMGGGFMYQLGGILTQGREMWQQARFLVAQLCPQHAETLQPSGWPAPEPLNQPVKGEDGRIDYGPVFQ